MKQEADVNEALKAIKQSFRLMMDGAIAQSMRNKGVGGYLNWGATLPRLMQFAEQIKSTMGSSHSSANQAPLSLLALLSNISLYDLSIALWKENVRECKILATMLMPPDEILPEVVDIWIEQIPSQEIAEQASYNLFQYLPYAPAKSFQWIASPGEYEQLCGYHVLSRLFRNGQEPNERGINEFLDQSLCSLQDTSLAVRKAAMQCIFHFAALGLVYERLAKSALKTINLELF